MRSAARMQQADVALRLPMHGGFGAFSTILDLPFIARHRRATQRDPRGAGAPAGRKRLVLVVVWRLRPRAAGSRRADSPAGLRGAGQQRRRRRTAGLTEPRVSWTRTACTPPAFATRISSRRRCRRHQARIRHHRRVPRQRHGAPLHVARALHRIRRAGGAKCRASCAPRTSITITVRRALARAISTRCSRSRAPERPRDRRCRCRGGAARRGLSAD